MVSITTGPPGPCVSGLKRLIDIDSVVIPLTDEECKIRLEMNMYMKICQNTEDSSHFIIHDHRQLALMCLCVYVYLNFILRFQP